MTEFAAFGAEFDVNSTYARTQANAETTLLADGRFVVVWREFTVGTTANQLLRAQIFEANGTAAGAELTLSTSGINPVVAPRPDGGFILVWEAFTAVRAQPFNADGTPASAAFDASPPSVQATLADIAAQTDGSFAIVWQDTRTSGGDTSGSGIHLRTYNSLGIATADVQLNQTTFRNQGDASVAAIDGVGYVVTWTDGAAATIYGRFIGLDGAPTGSQFAINTAQGSAVAVESSVTVLSNGNIAVAWYGWSDETSTTAHQIQIIEQSGQAVGAPITVPHGFYGGIATGPEIVALADGGFAIAWTANTSPLSDGSGRAVFVQAFGADGSPVSDPMLANTQTNGDQFDPSLVALPNGGFVVTWTDTNGAGGDDDQVMAQIFAPTGQVVISSDGGGVYASVSASENQTSVTQVVASSGGVDWPMTYSIVGGANAGLFVIDSETGELSFVQAPDFEAGGSEAPYEVIVRASSGFSSDDQVINVGIIDENERPIIVSNGGGTSAAISVAEGGVYVTTVVATDVDVDSNIQYSITGGNDAGLFSIDAQTGVVTFKTPTDYEAPIDFAQDNFYTLTVTASDGSLSSFQALEIVVTNVNEGVTITSNGGGSTGSVAVAEGQTAVADIAALDLDGDGITYSIVGGADASLFTVDAETGALRFVSGPNFEAPADSNADNAYDVIVQASDGSLFDTQSLVVSVTNVNEAPTIISNGGGASASVAVSENSSAVTTVGASDQDGTATLYAIAGGADAASFTVNQTTGELRFLNGPNFEAPADADGDNVYEVVVSASDGSLVDTQAVSVSVSNVNEAPQITSGGGGNTAVYTVNENTTAVSTITSTDPEGGARTYSISGGADGARFTINATTGVLSFVTGPNFEAPTDAGGNNVFDVIVTATDGVLTDSQALAITVGNVVDGVTLTGTNGSNTLTGTTAEDNLWGLGGNDTLSAGAGSDVLDGGKGNDTLTGGLGSDTLRGGDGQDVFAYGSINDSLSGSTDIIGDFSRSDRDRISLSGIDANTNAAGDQAFAFIASGSFTGVAGQLRYQQTGANTFVMGDVNGDGIADFVIQVGGLVNFGSGDFIL